MHQLSISRPSLPLFLSCPTSFGAAASSTPLPLLIIAHPSHPPFLPPSLSLSPLGDSYVITSLLVRRGNLLTPAAAESSLPITINIDPSAKFTPPSLPPSLLL